MNTPLEEAAKCALISMDSTLRSNLSVGLPLDLAIYRRDALALAHHINIDADNAYFKTIGGRWGGAAASVQRAAESRLALATRADARGIAPALSTSGRERTTLARSAHS